MRRNVKIMIFLSIVLSIAIIIIIVINRDNRIEKGISEIVNEKKLVYSQLGDTIYLKSKTWGLVGNRQTIYVSSYNKLDFTYDRLKDYKFEGEGIIFYKVKSDSLLLFVEHAIDEPNYFGSKVKVKQVEINGVQFRNLNENYLKSGIERFD